MIEPTIVRDWELMDRSDGVMIRFDFKQGQKRKVNLSDEDARELAETIQAVQASDDRPVTSDGERIV
jgi:cytochrome c553